MNHGIVQDQDVLRVQQRAEPTFQPAVEGIRVAGTFKQEGGGKVTASSPAPSVGEPQTTASPRDPASLHHVLHRPLA